MANWTPKLAASRSRRRIASIEKHLENIGYEYGDVDQGIVDKADEIIGHLEDLRERVTEALEEGRSL